MAERYLPAEIVHRGKQGFVMPLSEWLAGRLQASSTSTWGGAGSRAAASSAPATLARLLAEHRAGGATTPGGCGRC